MGSVIQMLTRPSKAVAVRDRIGKYMHTSSGRQFWPLDPQEHEVHIETIAHHLAMQCRYNGATIDFYSVAEHSVYCSRYGPEETALERLLHDASEAYIGDMIRPLKYDDRFRDVFLEAETAIEKVIARRFQLQFPWPADVKVADEAITAAERTQVLNRKHEPADAPIYYDPTNVADVEIGCWAPRRARVEFLERYYELTEARANA